MRRLFVFCVLCLVMGGFFVCGLGNNLGYGAEKPYELKFYSPYFEPHLMYKYAYKPWMDKVTEMSGGKVKVPVMFHALVGIRISGAAQHSARPQAMLMQAAGLQVIAPSRASDVGPLLEGAVE